MDVFFLYIKRELTVFHRKNTLRVCKILYSFSANPVTNIFSIISPNMIREPFGSLIFIYGDGGNTIASIDLANTITLSILNSKTPVPRRISSE